MRIVTIVLEEGDKADERERWKKWLKAIRVGGEVEVLTASGIMYAHMKGQ